MHHGLADGALAHRQDVLARAFMARQERFPNGPPSVRRPAREVWINPPETPRSHHAAGGDGARVELAGVMTKTITRAHLEPLIEVASI
ncbi:MAG: hypothetical protein IPM35_23350 [Myxococcales bacterium]|nr:hypothetical protein [Myxococcales bacterium]